MEIRICNNIASVQRGGDAPRLLTRKSALLLRLLCLWEPEDRVSIDLAAHVLNIGWRSVGRYVMTLRDEIGDAHKTLVTSSRGLQTTLQTDAARFKMLTEQACLKADGQDFRTMDPGDASEIQRVLDEAFQIWKYSPATGLDFAANRQPDRNKIKDIHGVLSAVPTLESIVSDWIDLHTEAVLLRADCWLAGGYAGSDLKYLVNNMLLPLAQRHQSDRVWEKALTAASRINDRPRQRGLWRLVQKAYAENHEEIPEELMEFATSAPITRSVSPEKRSGPGKISVPSEESKILELISLLGITPTSALKLRGSGLEPLDCIERADHRLYFAGVLAGKWVADRQTFNQFKLMLHRFQNQEPEGEVRFMVIHPGSSTFRRLEQMRAGEATFQSVNVLVRLARRYPCLQVRGIDHMPSFRVIVVDDDIVSFSPYDLENETVQTTRQGWAAPHVVLDPFAPFPLAPAFRSHFETEWKSAIPIKEEFK